MSQENRRYRNLFLLLCAACTLLTVLYGLVVMRRSRGAALPRAAEAPVASSQPAPAPPPIQPGQPIAKPSTVPIPKSAPTAKAPRAGRLFFLANTAGDTRHRLAVAPLDAPENARYSAQLSCERAHFGGGRGLCLAWDESSVPSAGRKPLNSLLAMMSRYAGNFAVRFDGLDQPGWRIPLQGLPNRVRVSANGRLAAVTVFVSGESYASSQFSTRTTIVNLQSGEVLADLESFTVTHNGSPLKSPDFNFWGVTFMRDENQFYATLWTRGKFYLVRCDLVRRSADIVREGVECPSLSPDSRRIAFKKRFAAVGAVTTWRVHLLDLKSMAETPLGEARSVDDQVEWLDNDHLLYSLPRQQELPASGSDIWVLPAVAGGSARLFLKDAFSPAVVPGEK